MKTNEELDAEVAKAVAPDTAYQERALRDRALELATRWAAGSSSSMATVAAAVRFEAYLKDGKVQ